MCQDKFICEICNKEFANKGNLNVHMNNIHINPKEIKYIKPKKECHICGEMISTSNYERHISVCNGTVKQKRPKNIRLSITEFICKHCGKECKNHNSLINHERLCKENPERQFTPFHDKHFQAKNYRNQFTKAKENGTIFEISNITRHKLSEKTKARSKDWNIKNGERIRKVVITKIQLGEWHSGNITGKYYYKNAKFDSSWELRYALYLDEHNIEWIRTTDTFDYIFEGITRSYNPDFYLPKLDEYVEIKGFIREKDNEKWSQFPKNKKLTVLFEDDLIKLGIDMTKKYPEYKIQDI